MTDSQQITILSGLPVATLNDIRLAAAIVRNIGEANDARRCQRLIEMINLALEEKQADYWTSYEDIDDDNQMAFI